MGRYNWILVFVFFSGFSVFSQEKYTKHTVLKGETISKIAEHYSLKSKEIYELNPDARKGIKFKSVLLIPTKKVEKNENKTVEVVSNYPEKNHKVLPKETIYGIAKQYGITVKDLYKINPTIEKSGLRNGQQIKIPGTASDKDLVVSKGESVKEIQKTATSEKINPKTEAVALPQSVAHVETTADGILREVLPKETKYAIAKEYGITIADLDKANPTLESEALKIGQKIIIPVKQENTANTIVVKENTNKGIEKAVTSQSVAKNLTQDAAVANKEIAKNETTVSTQSIVENNVLETEVVREVLAQETKYGIAKEYGITVKELERQNPQIVKRLPVGYKLNIRSLKPVEKPVEKTEIAAKEGIENEAGNYNIKSFHSTDFLDQLVSTASENIGTRYRIGGTTKEGFDCSGLMRTTFGAFDIQLPRTSFEQSRYGTKINTEDAQKGDLIFFKTNGRRQINHVGMVVEVNEGDIKFIHASVGGGVIISSVKEKYYSKRVTQVNRIL
ncbi:LysM peptidoglycan-binding domain-containing protein [Flavobacterium sp. W1B]|uniref:LysM peptidoglycan-binding domain-containing protein n=1 Tax=Flavobacterium sp. W1B TaxID=3394146 RepID=UPI0039BCADFC